MGESEHWKRLYGGKDLSQMDFSTEGEPGFRKADGEKPPMHLLPNEALDGAAVVMGYGAKKYAKYNWQQPAAWNRFWDACMRHLLAWQRGEDIDGESGFPHIDHAVCSILMLSSSIRRGVGIDDRAPLDTRDPESETMLRAEIRAEVIADIQAETEAELDAEIRAQAELEPRCMVGNSPCVLKSLDGKRCLETLPAGKRMCRFRSYW